MDRFCGSCNEYKPVEMFSRNKRRKDGLCVYCKQCMSERYSKYREENKDVLNAKKKIYRKNNPDKIQEYSTEYRNREEVKQRMKSYNKQYVKARYKSDDVYRYKLIIRADIYASLKQHKFIKKGNIEQIIGCDIEFFINHLKDTYYKNYGEDYSSYDDVHIDHIVPLATANTIDEVNTLCHYTNLQLLKAKDNQLKGQKTNWKL